MRKLVFFTILVSTSLIASTYFAPMPWEFALNYEKKQCAGFWGGDEFVTFELPSGWVSFEWQYSDDFYFVNTDIGTCHVPTEGEGDVSDEEACCKQLGYSFLSDNIGVKIITPFNLTAQAEVLEYVGYETHRDNHSEYFLAFATLAVLLIILVILLIREIKKEKLGE